MKLVLKGSAVSGWYSPPRGTHSGERHRIVGSGKVRLVGKKPEPVVKRGQVPKPNQDMLRSVLSDTRASIAAGAKGEALSAADIESLAVDNLRDHVKGRQVCVNVPARVAHVVLDDGRFKNQHETGASEVGVDVEGRRAAELNAFTYNTPPTASDLPIYGYIDDGPRWMRGEDENYRASIYGDVSFVLRDSTRSRTTITVGDSIAGFSGGKLAATPLTKPGLEGIGDGWRTAYHRRWQDTLYVEAQIHGGITLGDVSKIIVRDTLRGQQESTYANDLEARAKALGIPIEYRARSLIT